MQTAPGCRASTSSFAVCAFMQTMMSTSFLRAIQPSLFARMVNHVGRPAMLEGNMFFPLTGTPIWKMERMRTLFDDCDPEPLTVATWMVQSFTTGPFPPVEGSSRTAVADKVSDTTISFWSVYEKAGYFSALQGGVRAPSPAAVARPPRRGHRNRRHDRRARA